ncbi:MAG: hypothetical protein V1656_00610 [Candidatus Jorgensenbacteria bacterium]
MDSTGRKLSLRRLPRPPQTGQTELFERGDYLFNGEMLLACVVGWKGAELDEATSRRNDYRRQLKKKKSGGFRVLHVPHEKLKEFQGRFLHYFLYRMLGRGWIDRRIKGFIPKSGYVKNAKFHARYDANFVVRLDLKDAFPSVKATHVRAALEKILEGELKCYEAGEAAIRNSSNAPFPFSNPLLFSWRRAKWFRKAFKRMKPWRGLDTRAVIREFLDALLPLITYRGQLPQGARTSPFLLNIVLSHYGIPEKVFRWCRSRGDDVRVTLYADDFTISSATPISMEKVEELMALIEADGVFRFNRRKTSLCDRRQGAPLVTGLRLVRIPQGSGSKRLAGDTVSVPQRKIRLSRGLIHRAIREEKLRVKVTGYIDYLKGVYGPVLPNQVAVPYRQLQAVAGEQ